MPPKINGNIKIIKNSLLKKILVFNFLILIFQAHSF